MKLFFLDDSTQKNCNRDQIKTMVAVGGLVIEHTAAKALENAIDGICNDYGFPPKQSFKWSVPSDHWMRKNLTDEKRANFYREVLNKTLEFGGTGIVCAVDPNKNPANAGRSPEHDVFLLALERFDCILSPSKESGIVIVARPPGGRKDEDHFLESCIDLINEGTDYVKLTTSLATAILTMPESNSRLLQVSDLIVSVTNAMIAGQKKYAPTTFPHVKALLRSDNGRIGGVGVKIHPDFSYMNLYHWVLGDTFYKRGNSGFNLPHDRYPYALDENQHAYVIYTLEGAK